MRTLHELPPFRDRWSYLFLHYGTLDQDSGGLCFRNAGSHTSLPIDQLSLIMLGPGTTVTHAAVKSLAVNNCLLAWTGEEGIRMYAHSTGGTFSSRRLIRQASLVSDEKTRLEVARRMYAKRFPGDDFADKSMEQIRGMEGSRVRSIYREMSQEYGVPWEGRNYDQSDWISATPVNRALSAANSCLYGVCHAAIVSAGYSAGLGFIHTGKMLSFVYDVADLYKTELTVPLAFQIVSSQQGDLERMVRIACRDAFHKFDLMGKILPDIAEVLNAGDDVGETPEELEGRAVSMADRTEDGGVFGKPEPKDTGLPVGEGLQDDQAGQCRPDLDIPEFPGL